MALNGHESNLFSTATVQYDQHANQWMKEALASRQIIDTLQAEKVKLQREVASMMSQKSLVYDCCCELGVIDLVNDLINRKLHLLHTGHAGIEPTTEKNAVPRYPLRSPPKLENGNGIQICGSDAFQKEIVQTSSYNGQIERKDFRRKTAFKAEEEKVRDTMDIMGRPKVEALDELLSSTTSPRRPKPLSPKFHIKRI